MRTIYHEADDKIALEYAEDISGVLKANAEQRAVSPGSFESKGEFRQTMRVPQVVLMQICAKYGLDYFDKDDSKVLLKILKAPEYAEFRTVKGNI